MERTLRAPLLESSETAEDLTSVLPASLEVTFAFDRIASGDSQLFFALVARSSPHECGERTGTLAH